jgi:hypothetical protein
MNGRLERCFLTNLGNHRMVTTSEVLLSGHPSIYHSSKQLLYRWFLMLSLTITIRMTIPRLMTGFVALRCWSLVTGRCLLERLDLVIQVVHLST